MIINRTLLQILSFRGHSDNIGGVEKMSVGEMLNRLLKLSKVKNIRVEVDKNRLRPSDVTLQIPSIDEFTHATGWRPETKFARTLEDTVEWYTKVGSATKY